MSCSGQAAESSAKYFSYLVELREFFCTRDVSFGSPANLKPFLERLRADRTFANDLGSILRAVIYRVRDGISPGELLDLLLVAIGGESALRLDEAQLELSTFVESVFRSRWNTVPETMDASEPSHGGSSAENLAVPDAAYATANRLQAHGHPAQNVPFSGAPEFPGSDVHATHSGHATQPGSARYESAPAWAGKLLEDPYDSEPTSRRWVWGAVFAALVFVFCAGLFFAQRTAVDVFQRGDPHVRAIGTASHPTLAPTAQSSHPVEPAQTFDPLPEPAKPTAGRPLDPQADRTARMSEVNSHLLAQRVVDPRATVGVSPALMRHRLIYAPPTDYPRIAKLTHIQGKVVVEAVVSRNGEVTHADVISGHRLLRGAALRAVRQRKYRPYIVDGRPQTVATLVTVDFRLR